MPVRLNPITSAIPLFFAAIGVALAVGRLGWGRVEHHSQQSPARAASSNKPSTVLQSASFQVASRQL